ncbi:MAG TPA: thiamine pyrophosphate-dependent dehydrogenase E1 component subunit alpha [Alphaproteobacteria bacterium]|nr:thiamine pyrophosphate-dependent dehydrogenase E1 component subunit alpha [Alphaproteobacteria bacterium]
MTDRARDANGRNDAHVARLTALYRTMARIRAFEEATDAAVREGLVKGAAHLSIGQEAIAAGVCINLRRDDLITSTHRGHGHTIAKGADPQAMMCELFGREGGTCRGKGGSMHIADFTVGMLGANGVVAAGLPIAVGAAHAVKLAADGRIAACFFGDGAVNRGPFLEALNWAKVYELPVLFVCEDNKYSATTHTADLSAGPGPLARAQSLGVPGVTIDGNDVELVDATTAALVAKIRSGAGPQFLHTDTYRIKGHTAADPATYRKADEVTAQLQRDPLRRAAARLAALGVDPKAIDEIDHAAKAEIEKAYAHAKAAPWPADALAYADVQDAGFGQWR